MFCLSLSLVWMGKLFALHAILSRFDTNGIARRFTTVQVEIHTQWGKIAVSKYGGITLLGTKIPLNFKRIYRSTRQVTSMSHTLHCMMGICAHTHITQPLCFLFSLHRSLSYSRMRIESVGFWQISHHFKAQCYCVPSFCDTPLILFYYCWCYFHFSGLNTTCACVIWYCIKIIAIVSLVLNISQCSSRIKSINNMGHPTYELCTC